TSRAAMRTHAMTSSQQPGRLARLLALRLFVAALLALALLWAQMLGLAHGVRHAHGPLPAHAHAQAPHAHDAHHAHGVHEANEAHHRHGPQSLFEHMAASADESDAQDCRLYDQLGQGGPIAFSFLIGLSQTSPIVPAWVVLQALQPRPCVAFAARAPPAAR